MQNFKATIQYDGTNYHGWQIQANGRTVQGEITRVLSLLDHRPVTLYGAGRTDAGVHAEGQVANFFLERCYALRELRDAINGNLDRDIRILDVEPVAEGFNARYSATQKTYLYRIWAAEVVSPFSYRYVFHQRTPLDLDQMRGAAGALIGTHDFSAFTVADSEAEDRVRTLTRVDIENTDEITIVISGDGFLRYMVRTVVGTLIEVGRGKRTAQSLIDTLDSRDRTKAGPSAPANGLTLLQVDY
ncbi:MAG: tRNA pseudouridine(38-40) synthase TruA [Blastocatellia bacterium]